MDVTPKTAPLEPRPAPPPRKTRRGLVVGLVLALLVGATGFLLIKVVGDASLYFYNADEAVAQRAEEHLQHAIGHGKRGHRARGLARGGAEFRRKLRQHGVADAKGAGADEGGQGKQRDGARFGGQGRHG